MISRLLRLIFFVCIKKCRKSVTTTYVNVSLGVKPGEGGVCVLPLCILAKKRKVMLGRWNFHQLEVNHLPKVWCFNASIDSSGDHSLPPPPRPQGNRRTFAHVVSPRLFMCCHPCNFVNRLGETLSDFQFEIFLTISKISSNLPISSTRYCQSFRFVNTFLDLSLELGEAKLRCKLQNLEGGGKGSKP